MLPYMEKPGAVRRREEADISANARIKSYPDGSRAVLVCEAPIFKTRTGWEPVRAGEAPAKRRKGREGASDPARAVRRAKAQVRDLALCTPFRWFVTLTLDAARVDRYDMAAITRKLNAWLDNQVRRRGLAYVLVPERHKDGAIHFHGFFNDALEAVDSGTVSLPGQKHPKKPRNAAQRAAWLAQGGHVVYNLPGWSLGFTTALELYGDYPAAVGYVCKYIGKELDPEGQPVKLGGRWYYSGGPLGRPEVAYGDIPLQDAAQWPGAYQFSVREAHLGFVLAKIPSEGGENDGDQ